MIVERGRGRDIIIRGREKNGARYEKTITGYWPYAFVSSVDAEYIDEAVRKEEGYVGLYGEELTKIVCATPHDVKQLSYHGTTWEGNIPYENRVLSDYINDGNDPIENYNHRTWYMDCEWSPTTNKMRVMVVYDSFTKKEYVWFVEETLGDEYKHGKGKPFKQYGEYTYETPALAFKTERSMLIHFLRHMKKQDPDIITGWYVVGADIRQIMERCKACGISESGLSPMRRVRYEFGDWAQPIVGRNCIDLMIAVSKLWELKNGKLPSYKLDDVAYEILGEQKIQLEKGHNESWWEDKALYLHYARQDVRLLPKLDEAVNALDYYTSLQHIVQCDIRSTPFITKMFTQLVLTDPDFDRRIPTRPQFSKVDYEGADILDVIPDVYDNVGILDIKAMYHSNADKYNISWDTLDEEGQDCGNGTKFSQKNKGLLVRQMDKMTDLRNIFKMKMIMSDGSEQRKWDTMQFAAKTLVASMYGVCGDAKYGMYHPEIAAAITFTSRETLGELMVEAQRVGFNVIYGHTDSVFCEIPSPEEGMSRLAEINERMSPIITQFEKWCPRIIFVAKNRYTAKVSWTDGEYHEPNIYVKGIELKQTRMPTVMKEAMLNTITGILNGESEESTTNTISTLIESVMSGNTDAKDLCMKGKIERDLSKYSVLSGSSAGAAWANEHLGKGYRAGSFFLVTLDQNGKYIAFDDPSEIEGIKEIGTRVLVDRFIIKKILPYYALAGWDVQPLENAKNGLSKLSWL
jgi:DNA polymerase elongation subunit (family B)